MLYVLTYFGSCRVVADGTLFVCQNSICQSRGPCIWVKCTIGDDLVRKSSCPAWWGFGDVNSTSSQINELFGVLRSVSRIVFLALHRRRPWGVCFFFFFLFLFFFFFFCFFFCFFLVAAAMTFSSASFPPCVFWRFEVCFGRPEISWPGASVDR